ncbi:tyrosine-type recombinase/integrase [Clostridium sp. CF012]|uniref:tyrosine-type recombinase/integrase n=1 Tax=Clostridium sp. CF012 TaxID=2843319 RepID=UPI001C0DF5EA|nr:tyrosine-type recombinase/integrase [Clostridium sp. CF012]MBU3145738.1 tyrosine-type recombinase/integrase [Clostridium sp. CF012]
MNTVEPLRDQDLLFDIEDYLKTKNYRDYVLFETGIFLGRRISDMLKFKVRDVKNKDYVYFRESKTNKEAKIVINDELKKIYKDYIKDMKDYEFLFQSREGKNKPITRQRVWQILNEAADFFEYKENIGCHTLRKTFGYWLYKQSKDVMGIKELLNQSDIAITKRYIGINQDSKDSLVKGLSFKRK